MPNMLSKQPFTAAISFIALYILGVAQIAAQSPDVLPPGVLAITATEPEEISGVSSSKAPDGTEDYYIIGDQQPRQMFILKNNGTVSPFDFKNPFGNSKDRVCDAEDIDVEYKRDGKRITFVLSEDAKTIYIEGGAAIELPSEFFERCERGAEGLSVKRREDGNGWDLVVVSEGGVPDGTHIPHQSKVKTADCEPEKKEERDTQKKQKEIACPLPLAIYNPTLARYWVSEDGMQSRLIEMQSIQTANLLKDIDPGQGFRTSDIAWFGDTVLLLLGSMPLSRNDSDGYKYTWIKGFSLDGSAIPDMTMKLEQQWGLYRDRKNWEGLDTTADGTKLVTSYDKDDYAKKGPSHVLIFSPYFGRN